MLAVLDMGRLLECMRSLCRQRVSEYINHGRDDDVILRKSSKYVFKDYSKVDFFDSAMATLSSVNGILVSGQAPNVEVLIKVKKSTRLLYSALVEKERDPIICCSYTNC